MYIDRLQKYNVDLAQHTYIVITAIARTDDSNTYMLRLSRFLVCKYFVNY